MNQRELEKHIKGTLERYSSKLDTDQLWEELAPHIEGEKRKRRFLWMWLWGIGLIFLGITVGLSVGFPIKWPVNTTELLTDLTEDLVDQCDDDWIKDGTEQSEGILNQPAHSSAHQLTSHFNEEGGSALKYSRENTNLIRTLKVEPILPKQLELRIGNKQKTYYASESIARLELIPTEKVPTVFSLPNSLFEKDLLGNLKQPTSWKWGIEVGAGIFILERQFKVRTNATNEGQELLAQRQAGETPLEAIALNLNGIAQHRSGWYGKLGLSFMQINERLDQNIERVEVEDNPDAIVEINILGETDTSFVYGNLPIVRTYQYDKRHFNRYELLDIPISAGYRWHKNRWTFGAEAGISINLSMEANGELRNENGEIVSYQSIYKQNIGWSYFTSLNLGYKIIPHLELTIAPTFHRFRRTFTTNDYPLGQGYHLWGVRGGVIYWF